MGASTHWEQRDPECCAIPLSPFLKVQVSGSGAVLLWQFELGSVHHQSLSASTGEHCTTNLPVWPGVRLSGVSHHRGAGYSTPGLL